MSERRFAIGDLELERWLVGELTGEAKARVDAAVESDPALKAHVAERRAEQAAFQLQRPPLRLPEAPKRALPWWVVSFACLGAAAALVVVVVPRLGAMEDDGTVRMRGGPKVSITVQREERIFEYRQGVLLAPKDRIRLTVESPAAGYLTVLGRDANQAPVVHYDNVALTAGGFTAPDSLELDDSPRPEELVVVVTPAPVDANALLAELRAGKVPNDATVLELAKEPLP